MTRRIRRRKTYGCKDKADGRKRWNDGLEKLLSIFRELATPVHLKEIKLYFSKQIKNRNMSIIKLREKILLLVDLIVMYTEALREDLGKGNQRLEWKEFWRLTKLASCIVRYTAGISKKKWIRKRAGKLSSLEQKSQDTEI